MRKQIEEELKEGTDSSHDSHDANDYPDPSPPGILKNKYN